MSSLNKNKYNKMLTSLWIMLIVGIAGASQLNYIIDLPKEFVEKISRTGAQHEDDGFWHPRLTVRTVQLPSVASGSNATEENPRFVSFLALKQTTGESQVDTLRFMTNDGSDADTKLQGNSKKMICQCRFVRDFMGEESVNIDSVDDISSEPASDAEVISSIFAQKSSQKSSLLSPDDVSGGIFVKDTPKALQKDRFPVESEDTATTEEVLMQTILEKMKEKEAHDTETDSKSQLMKQLKSLLGADEEEKVAKKELTETEKLTQLIQSLSKKEEEKKAPEPENSADFVKFLNMYEQYQKYETIKNSHVEKADESDTFTSLLKSLSKKSDYSEKSDDEMDSLAEMVKLQKQLKQKEEEKAKEAKLAKIKEALSGLLDD